MFGFMKKTDKDKEEKERKKREKQEKKLERKTSKAGSKDARPLSQEELHRLEEAKKGLFRNFSDASKHKRGSNQGADGMAVAYTDPNGSISPSDGTGSESGSLSSPSMENISASGTKYTSQRTMELSRPQKPPVAPKPDRGILKGQSRYGPDIPNYGVVGDLDDTVTLETNTQVNEIMSGIVPDHEKLTEMLTRLKSLRVKVRKSSRILILSL